MIRLLNSAMMPEFGNYEYVELSRREFADAVKSAHDR